MTDYVIYECSKCGYKSNPILAKYHNDKMPFVCPRCGHTRKEYTSKFFRK